MEACINTALYFIAAVAVFVPFFGFVVSPGLIVNTAVTTVLGNMASQLKDLKLIDGFVEKKKNSAIGKIISSIFSAM